MAGALGRVLRLPGPPKLTVAGRTDAGVHARGQVVHVDVPAAAWDAVAGRAVTRLAGVLPADVRVRAAGPAPAGFDARFAALWRRYSYRVCDDPAAADPLRRHETLWYFRRLDLAAMNEAALACLGEHDFAAFCRRREGATTIRALRALAWHRDDDGVGVGVVVADAFCHNMVRSLVGALIAVGEGRKPPAGPLRCSRPRSAIPRSGSCRRTGCASTKSVTPRPPPWRPAPPPPAASAPPAARRSPRPAARPIPVRSTRLVGLQWWPARADNAQAGPPQPHRWSIVVPGATSMEHRCG